MRPRYRRLGPPVASPGVAIVDDDIERVRAASPIVDVVQQLVALRRVGRRWTGLCPFHAERTPSFSVNDELGRYYCFGCGAKGDVFRFVQDVEHLDFVGCRGVAGQPGRHHAPVHDRRRGPRPAAAASSWWRRWQWPSSGTTSGCSPRPTPARRGTTCAAAASTATSPASSGSAGRPTTGTRWCRAPGLPADVLRDAGLAFSNRRDRLQDAFRARVMFPIFNEVGDPVAFGGRVLPGQHGPGQVQELARRRRSTPSRRRSTA